MIKNSGKINNKEIIRNADSLKNYRRKVGIYMFKVNNRNTKTRFEICSMLTIKTP